MVLTKEQIIAVRDVRTKEITPPGWPGSIWVQSMTAYVQERFAALVGKAQKEEDFTGARARLAALSIIEDPATGTRVFEENDWQVLAAKDKDALQFIVDEVLALSNVAEVTPDELRGNLPTGQSESSSSS